jgi:hypothetical protein
VVLEEGSIKALCVRRCVWCWKSTKSRCNKVSRSSTSPTTSAPSTSRARCDAGGLPHTSRMLPPHTHRMRGERAGRAIMPAGPAGPRLCMHSAPYATSSYAPHARSAIRDACGSSRPPSVHAFRSFCGACLLFYHYFNQENSTLLHASGTSGTCTAGVHESTKARARERAFPHLSHTHPNTHTHTNTAHTTQTQHTNILHFVLFASGNRKHSRSNFALLFFFYFCSSLLVSLYRF